MKENKTSSMLQRLPLILAVTAASYGLPLQAHASRHAASGFSKDSGKTTHSAPAQDRAKPLIRTR